MVQSVLSKPTRRRIALGSEESAPYVAIVTSGLRCPASVPAARAKQSRAGRAVWHTALTCSIGRSGGVERDLGLYQQSEAAASRLLDADRCFALVEAPLQQDEPALQVV